MVCMPRLLHKMHFRIDIPTVTNRVASFLKFWLVPSSRIKICRLESGDRSHIFRFGEEWVQLCLVRLTVLCVFFQTAGRKQEAK